MIFFVSFECGIIYDIAGCLTAKNNRKKRERESDNEEEKQNECEEETKQLVHMFFLCVCLTTLYVVFHSDFIVVFGNRSVLYLEMDVFFIFLSIVSLIERLQVFC